MTQYKLTYFDMRGLGEPIRLILTLAGQPFEDNRLPMGSLTPKQKEELGLEWGQLPVLEVDGVMKSQSYAVCRYLAKKYNLAGKDDEEEYRCDVVVEAVRDLVHKVLPMITTFFSGDMEKLAKEKRTFEEVDAPLHLGRFDKLLEKKGNTWTVGNSITWADVILMHFVTHFETALDMQLSKWLPSLQKLINAVKNEPKIKSWLEKRPKTQF